MARLRVSGECRMSEPELRFTPNGQAVVNFSVVTEDVRKNDDGDWEKVKDHWFDVVAWGKTAEWIAEIPAWTTVHIDGSLTQERWEAEDGTKRSKSKIVIDKLHFSVLSGKNLEVDGTTIRIVRSSKKERPVNNGVEDAVFTSHQGPAYDYDEEPF